MSQPPPLSRSAPPKRGLSGCALAAVILVGVGVVSIPVIGILAAIAIPQYQDYVARSRVMQGFVAAQDLQRTIDRYRSEQSRCPDAQALGMSEPATVRLSPSAEAEAVFVLDPPSADNAACGFEMRFSKLSLAVDDKTMRFVSDTNAWDCRGGTLDPRFRPAQCR